ncbi:MAG: polysaccharide deacetylase family protein [Lachnospiraceae bacterium]|nr:polysaccharide deacetylase family protein [Lachnospiraceae bacterium]
MIKAKSIRGLLLKGITVTVLAGALTVNDPIINVKDTTFVSAAQSVESYREKILKNLSKVYKYYLKSHYSDDEYLELTVQYENGIDAINFADSKSEIKSIYAEYKEILRSIRPSVLISYQEKQVGYLVDAYDKLVSKNKYSEEDFSELENIKNEGIESIYNTRTKTKAKKARKNAIEELEAIQALPEEKPDVIEKLEAIRQNLIDKTDYYDSLDNSTNGTWCFQRKTDHSPSGTYEYFKITDYNGFYLNTNVTDDDKVIYLTFDCGYPSNLTQKILDTLAKHNAKASFFVTKMYLEECTDYAIRMKEEGHAVCNHTVTHTDLTNKSVEKIASEIIDVAEYFYEKTGYEFDPYFRTPTGAYTKRLMTIIKDAGYKTVFWSIAYGDYDEHNQPAPGYVTNHFKTYHHNGAVALMHNDSTSNANELDAVLTLLEEAGYRFGALSEIE